jgi:hypothetical protein
MSDTKYAGTKSNSIDSKDKPPIKKPLKVPSLKVFFKCEMCIAIHHFVIA